MIHEAHDKESQEIGIDEVANTLSVSVATIRNWIKSGWIESTNKKGRSLVFNRTEIGRLKQAIDSGTLQRLKSRRNKRAVNGHYIPVEYVDAAQYMRIAEHILDRVMQLKYNGPHSLVLAEVALHLLIDKKHLLPVECSSERSFIEWAASGRLDTGPYETILRELFDFKVQEISDDEVLVLRSIHSLKIEYFKGNDLLGLLYMALSNLGTRKRSGSYYTPLKLVDSLVEKSLGLLDDTMMPSVIDPCCGSGNFLVTLFISLRSKRNSQGQSLAEAEKQLFRDCIFGFDIDKTAVALAKINLALASDVRPVDAMLDFNIEARNTLTQWGSKPIPKDTKSYDLVIGNPPWGYSFTREEILALRGDMDPTYTSFESFSLFIEYGISTLKDNGILSYVLPESLLNVQTHALTRKRILCETEMMYMTLLGHQFSKVFAPAIALTVRKRVPSLDHTVVIETAKGIREIPQQRFLRHEMHIFNVHASNEEDRILEHMKSLSGARRLKDHADFALGIVTGDNKQYVGESTADFAEPVLKGTDVFKYNFYAGNTYLVYQPEKFQQVAPEHLYRATEKLIYRFINQNLLFAYDNQGTLSLNSANIVIPRIPGYSMKYIMAVLNSRPAQFFHAFTFSSIKVLRKHIESIPIPPCSIPKQSEITDLVDLLMQSEDSLVRMGFYNEIDRLIAALYELDFAQWELINRQFRDVKFMSR